MSDVAHVRFGDGILVSTTRPTGRLLRWFRPDARRNDSGTLTVELIVATSIFAVAMTMTAIIVGGITESTGATIRQTTATEAQQSIVSRLDQLIRGMTTPQVAWAAQNVGTSVTVPAAGSSVSGYYSPCWGSTSFLPNGVSTTVTTGISGGVQNIASLQAYDSDFIFCSYAPGTYIPHIYEIKIVTPCVNATFGYCTLEALDWGANTSTTSVCDPFPITVGATSANYVLGNTADAKCTATVVQSWPNEWCDAFCQGCPTSGVCSSSIVSGLSWASPAATWNVNTSVPFTNNGTVSGTYSPTEPTFNFSCQNLYNGGVSGVMSYSGSLSNPCVYQTPPMFCYYETTPPTSTCAGLNTTAQPLDLESQADASGLQDIQTVVFTETHLANTNALLSSPLGSPGTPIEDTIKLTGIGSQG